MLSDEENKAIERLDKRYDFFKENPLATKEIEELKKQLDLDNECEIALNSKIMDLEKEIEELKKNKEETKNKLVRYIAIKEGKDYEQICREFEI